MADETLALVIDTGSATTKVGFAGADTPKSIFQTVVRFDETEESDEIYIGQEPPENRKNLSVLRPIQHGIVRNWALAEMIWKYAFTNELKVSQEEHPVLLTEPPLNPKMHREKCCQLYFESFNVPALYMATTSLLSLYGSAKTSGMVLDIGDGVAHTVPIHDGSIIPHAVCRLDIGGFDLTSHLIRYIDNLKRNTPEDRRIANDIKEKLCYVAQNYQEEYKRMVENPKDFAKQYKLPDGKTISLTSERIACPEILFTPELAGRTCPNLADICYHSVRMCEPELHRTMFSAILVTGGTSMFKGFLERCEKEVDAMVNGNAPVKLTTSNKRSDIAVWIGGSVVAALPTFQQMWVTREEYDEAGPTVIHRKCF